MNQEKDRAPEFKNKRSQALVDKILNSGEDPDWINRFLDKYIPVLQTLEVPEGTLISPNIQLTDEEEFKVPIEKRKAVRQRNISRVYEGGWYCQSEIPTCMAWAFANAALAMGLPDYKTAEYIGSFIKFYRNTPDFPSFNNAVELLNSRIESPIELFRIKENGSFKKLLQKSFNSKNGRFEDMLVSTVPPVLATYENAHFPEIVINEIERGHPLVITVDSDYEEEKDNHAVCIGGYRVDENGFMDCQVIDSALGIFWIPRERIEKTRGEVLYSARPRRYTGEPSWENRSKLLYQNGQ